MIASNRTGLPRMGLKLRSHCRGSLLRFRVPTQLPQAFILRPSGDGSTAHLDEATAPAEPFGPFLLGPGTYEVGRGAQANLRLSLPTVSTRHALLLVSEDDVMMITDLKSTNGTTVNGMELEPLQPFEVLPGSDITFGDPYLARFNLELVVQEEEVQPDQPLWPEDGTDFLTTAPSSSSEVAAAPAEDVVHYAAAPGHEGGGEEAAGQQAGAEAALEPVAADETVAVAGEAEAGHAHAHAHAAAGAVEPEAEPAAHTEVHHDATGTSDDQLVDLGVSTGFETASSLPDISSDVAFDVAADTAVSSVSDV